MTGHDPWTRFRLSTRARIGLGRAGDGLPTAALLAFQQAQARARDAVHGAVNFDRLEQALAPLACLRVESAAGDRATYLRRPDLGRQLAPDAAAGLRPVACDAVFVIGDGLSAAAVTDHAVATVTACLDRLTGWTMAPIILAGQARVALGDPIAERLGAPLCVMLVGERPGLSVANSLGAYVTWQPRIGRKDAERNCVSNIHGDGLGPGAAADKITWLMREAARRRVTGIALKDEAGPSLPGVHTSAR